MKKTGLFILILFLATIAHSQNFSEGIITYNISITGKDAAMVKGMMPNEYLFYLKDEMVRLHINGGMMGTMFGVIIVDPETKISYILQEEEKKALKIKSENNDENSKESKNVVENMKTTEIIAGYKCTKYKMTTNLEGKEIVTFYWVSKDFNVKISDVKNTPGVSQFAIEGLEGFPLKVQTSINEQGTSFDFILEVVKIEKKKLKDSMFKVPSDFTIEDFDFSSFK
ncbi:MAG: DUF4412 domain-containing protein [Bacteroidota bacterium]|nr:DUF4412 domain-containing protein [Bacteroidota bacterium]